MNGKPYRKNGPTVVNYHQNGNICSEQYFIYWRLHNEYGPAIIKYDEDGVKYSEDYYLDGILIMKGEEAERYINSTKPIKVRRLDKLKLLYNVCVKRNLQDRADEIARKLLINTL